MGKETIIVSACLMGIRSRYNGTHAKSNEALDLAKDGVLVPVCPEQLGGLPTPRPRAEICGEGANGADGEGAGGGDEDLNAGGADVLAGRATVTDEFGADATRSFIKGAEEVLNIARLTGARRGVLKEGSPSCGVTTITKKGKDVAGSGVTTALLKDNGIDIIGVK